MEAPAVDPRQPGSPKGSFAFLDQYREYRKDVSPRKQFVQIKLDQLLLDMIDANGPLTAVECPVVGTPQQRCSAIRSEVKVTRTGGSRGATSAVLSTRGGSARSGTDFTPTRTLVRFENGDRSPRIVEIPIREDRAVESPKSFTVSLTHVRCARLGQHRSATAMILDDDQPPPTFTIGGTGRWPAGLGAGAVKPGRGGADVG